MMLRWNRYDFVRFFSRLEVKVFVTALLSMMLGNFILLFLMEAFRATGQAEGDTSFALFIYLTVMVLCGALLWLALYLLMKPFVHLRKVVTWADPLLQSNTKLSLATHPLDECEHYERVIKQLQKQIKAQQLELERRDITRQELINQISLDVRTPMACAQGYLETLLQHDPTESPMICKNYVKVALRQMSIVEGRIGELFELSRLDHSALQTHPEVFCLADLIQDVVQMERSRAKELGVDLRATAHQRTLVHADLAMIERVLHKLIDHALRQTQAGCVIHVVMNIERDKVTVEVADNGLGVSEENLNTLFERYRVKKDHSLGLAIVKRILDLHGVAIKASSKVEQGSCFAFSLARSSN